MDKIFADVKKAGKLLPLLGDERRSLVLNKVADAVVANKERLLEANALDLNRMDKSNPLYDRLMLTGARLDDIAADMRNVASLPSPLGRVTKAKTLSNGMRLHRVSVPFGVIGMI